MYIPAQEIGLLNAAYDGDVESLVCCMEREVPVDSVSPVRNDYLFPIAPSFINGMGLLRYRWTVCVVAVWAKLYVKVVVYNV